MPPTSLATIGRASDIASRITYGNDSAQEGWTKTSMPRSAPSGSLLGPRKVTAPATPSARAWLESASRSGPSPTIASCAPGWRSSSEGAAAMSVSRPFPGRSSVSAPITGPRRASSRSRWSAEPCGAGAMPL